MKCIAILESQNRRIRMIGCFGEIVVDCFPDKKVVGGAPLNVAAHLKRLEVEVDVISAIGADKNGVLSGQLLEQLQLHDRVTVLSDLKTGVATISFGESGHSFEILRGSAWEHITAEGTSAYGVLVYGTLAMVSLENREQFDLLKSKSKTTRSFCDLNLRAPHYDEETIEWSLERADYLKVSDEEALELGQIFGLGDDITTILTVLKERWQLQEIYCTLGAQGSISILKDGLFEYSFQRRSDAPIVDTVGAGDAFSASLLYALYFGTERKNIIPQAHEFAAAICTFSGAIPQDTSMYRVFIDSL